MQYTNYRYNWGWRVYDNDAILCIQITAFLRQLDIPIKEIKNVIDERTIVKLNEVIMNRISVLKSQRMDSLAMENRLVQVLLFLQEQSNQLITEENLPSILNIKNGTNHSNHEMEVFSMSSFTDYISRVKFIKLPSMRVVYNIAVSESPEDEAMNPVIEWIQSANLVGTARLFGGNMPPMPSGEGKPYGYGLCASIPEYVTIPSHLKEMTLPGGLYAMLESSDDIGGSWKELMRQLSKNNKYRSDRSRLCLEEHIRNDNPEDCGNEYFLNLLEPVKLK